MIFLFRFAGRGLTPSDIVIPISFNAMQTTQQPRRSPRNRKQSMKILQPTTKMNSKQIPPPYQPQVVPKRIPEPSKKNISTSSKKNTGPKKLQPPAIPTTLAHKRLLTLSPPSPFSNRKLSPSVLPTDKLTLVNPELKIPQTLPSIEIPPPQMENIDTYRSPENFLYKKPLPVLKDSKDLDIFTRHIPKQKEIDEFLQILKAKVTKDYKLPLLAKSIIAAYAQSPAFKSIYQYITTNTLPPNRRLQRSIICNADNYIVADGLLFKLQQTYRNKQLVNRCLLVIPETFEHVVFHMYHDSLLGAHYGPLNTYYTIKDKYHIHNLLDKLNKYVASCEECQKQKSKKRPTRYFHPRIPLDYNPMSYISADIKYMPKGIYNYEFLLVIVCEITGFVLAIPLIKT